MDLLLNVSLHARAQLFIASFHLLDNLLGLCLGLQPIFVLLLLNVVLDLGGAISTRLEILFNFGHDLVDFWMVAINVLGMLPHVYQLLVKLGVRVCFEGCCWTLDAFAV
jgi:hypothetical protein